VVDFEGALLQTGPQSLFDNLKPFEMTRETRHYELQPDGELRVVMWATEHLSYQDSRNWSTKPVANSSGDGTRQPRIGDMWVKDGKVSVLVQGHLKEWYPEAGNRVVPGPWFLPLESRTATAAAGRFEVSVSEDGEKRIVRTEKGIEVNSTRPNTGDRNKSWLETIEYVFEPGLAVPADVRTYVDNVLVKEERAIALSVADDVIR
jgi:hypothetical protein